ncbi:permease [uncultured Paracoccus sp.]|uniref:permease n=1 Tax=uncultured Paracoccus sp. TaxID=189685 RepID=UPI002606CC1B|nr:permease [uncultured Paracoccus sp.]
MSVFSWMNDDLLRMVWLDDLVEASVGATGLDPASRIGGSVQFFVYDVIKIFILLSVLIFAISYVQSHFPPERTRAMLGGRSGLGANILAALLGTLTPFCSCSSIPLFIGFTAAGLPLAITFSFLISSPLVDLASVILLASIFNWPIALAYVAVGLVVAVVGGTVIGRLGMEGQVAEFVRTVPVSGDVATMTRSGGRCRWRLQLAFPCMPTSSALFRSPRRWWAGAWASARCWR